MNLSQCTALQPQFWTTALTTYQTRVIPSRFNTGATATPQFELLYLSENHLAALFEVQALLGSPTQPGGLSHTRGRHGRCLIWRFSSML